MGDSPDRHLVWKVAGLGLAMFAFGFALVPLYDVFCAVTGFGGKTATAAAVVAEQPDLSRTVRVEFLASVPRGVPFTLEPEVSHLEVHPGQLYETHFRARNLTGSPWFAIDQTNQANYIKPSTPNDTEWAFPYELRLDLRKAIKLP